MRVGDIGNKPMGVVPGDVKPATTKTGAAEEARPAAKAAQANVQVRMGNVAAAASDVAKRPNVPDASRVAEVLQQIAEGKFKIDFNRLAGKMLDEEAERGRRKK
jgi:flagellar biosynthesis anti-sigma factor FlgM